MLDLKLEADFRPMPMTLDEGMGKALDLLRKLSGLPAFASGWEAGGVRLDQDEAAFAEAMKQAQAGEGAEGGYHFAIAENARGTSAPFLPAESYIAETVFNNVDGGLYVVLSMTRQVATFATIHGVVKQLNAWADLQHVSAGSIFYSPEDSPIDSVNRRGIGWAGWVPFPLTRAELPEAGYLETLGQGTFVASQESEWEVSDRAAVKRAQALELRLNALGMLPTRTALRKGTWGQAD